MKRLIKFNINVKRERKLYSFLYFIFWALFGKLYNAGLEKKQVFIKHLMQANAVVSSR